MTHIMNAQPEDLAQAGNEQERSRLMRESAKIYLSIATGTAALFFLAASLSQELQFAAKLGGASWVWLLSLIIAMPIVTTRVKKKLRSDKPLE